MSSKRTGETNLPGDPSRDELIERMIRVDHAGEYGAVRIYEGQLAVLGKQAAGGAIQEMAVQERQHLATFDRLIAERQVRPTALSPLWHMVGFALGAASASLGERAAMACTVAVEDVIEEHYAHQLAELGDDEAELKSVIDEFREDEVAHRNTALEHEARATPGYELLTGAVRAGSRLAIWLSTRV